MQIFAYLTAGCLLASSALAADHPWKGRSVAFLGDSITDIHHCGCTTNYWGWMAEDMGIRSYVYGLNGRQWDSIPEQAEKLRTEHPDVDAILVFMGTNDYNDGVPLGAWYETVRETANRDGVERPYPRRRFSRAADTLRGRINVAMECLKRTFPDAQIVVMPPIHRGYAKFGPTNVQPDESFPNAVGLYVDDYVAAILETARVWAVPVIDLNADCGLFPNDPAHAKFFHLPDTDLLHPNDLGHRRIADTLAARLASLPPGFVRSPKAAASDGPVLRIAVMSDLQGYASPECNGMRNLERMLDVFAELKPDVVVNDGDIGDDGFEGWKGAQYYLERCTARLGRLPHVVSIGNHELGVASAEELAAGRTQERNLKDFNAVFGMDEKPVHAFTIGGYDFISCSFRTPAGYDEEVLEDLKAALDRAVERDAVKPVFVVTHYHPAGTVPGVERPSARKPEDPFRRLLNGYPQVVNLSGHTHRSLRDPRSVWQGEFTVFETSTLGYGSVVEEPESINQIQDLTPYGHESVGGLFLEVYPSRLVARRFSARDRREIEPENRWEYALPYDPSAPKYGYGTRAANEAAPEFPDDIEPTVWWDCGFFYFLWNPVKDPSKVLRYRVEATDQTGLTRTWYATSDFYRVPEHRADRVVLKLPPDPFHYGDRVKVRITPIGFFGREGRPHEWGFVSKYRYPNATAPACTCPQ